MVINSPRIFVFNINSAYPEITGGRETWLENVSKRLVVENNIIHIICRNGYGKSEKKYNNLMIYHKFISTKYIFQANKFIKPLFYMMDIILFVFYSTVVMARLRMSHRQNLFIIVGMNPGFESLPGQLISKLLRVPFICSVRSIWSYEQIRSASKYIKNKLILNLIHVQLVKFEKYTLKHSTLIAANGYDTKERLSHIVSNNISILPNGVDKRFFESTENDDISGNGRFVIGSVATLRDIKGIPEAIKSIPYMLNKKTNFVFQFIGKGDPSKYIELAQKLDVSKYVEFTGESRDVSRILPKTSIVLCLSGGCGISHSLLEAMAAGKPVIAWNTPVYSQIITSECNGILVPENNIIELANKIIYLMDNPSKAKKIGDNASTTAKNFEWNNIVSIFEKLIDKVVSK